MTDQALVELAFTMLEKSYVPYSHFPVGAALEGADGRVYTGCNIENSAYGSTICAESTALVKAIIEGCRPFTSQAVVGTRTEYCTAGPAVPAARCSMSSPPTWRCWWPSRTTPLSHTLCANCFPVALAQSLWHNPVPITTPPR